MKKADFRLPSPAGFFVFEAPNPAFTKKEQTHAFQ